MPDGDPGAARRRRIRLVQKYVLNPPVKVAAGLGLVPGLAILETTGRRTGRPRRNVVGVHVDGSTAWIVAEQGRHAGYVRNLETDPRVRLRLGRRWRDGHAHVADDDDPNARLEQFRLPGHAATVRHFGTDLTSVRVDLE